jgi:glycosyltransferase involved in cell wall biosynthesis
MDWIFFAIAFLCLGLALHPFVTYPLSLKLIQVLKPVPITLHNESEGPADDDPAMTCAICFCTYNEASSIGRTIDSLLKLQSREPNVEILAYVDGATDGTAEILLRHSDRIRVIVSPERRGKMYGMSQLAPLTQATILIFTDANVRLDMDIVRTARRYFRDPEVGCLCGNLQYVDNAVLPSKINAVVYRPQEEQLKQLESETGSTIGGDGALLAFRRDLYRPIPAGLIEDFYLPLSILCDGFRVLRAEEMRAYLKAVEFKEELRRKTRIACQALHVHWSLWPRLRKLDALNLYKYLSHKFLRWISFYTFAGAGLAFAAGMIVADWTFELAILATAFAAVLFVGWTGLIAALRRPVEILLAVVAVGIGAWHFLRGETYQIWDLGRSNRQMDQLPSDGVLRHPREQMDKVDSNSQGIYR